MSLAREQWQVLIAQGISSSGFQDMVWIETRAYLGGPSGPGTYTLQNSNYQDCPLCLITGIDCEYDASAGRPFCQRYFFAGEGVVEIFSVTPNFDARIESAYLYEIDVEGLDFWAMSIAVDNFAGWCLEDVSVSGAITEP